MDWNKIKEKYPKAFNKMLQGQCWFSELDDYDTLQISPKEEPDLLINERDLYDFFDEQGIYINICTHKSIYDEPDKFTISWYDIFLNKAENIAHDGNYYSRTEAEEKAFEKAFEILEGKL